MYAFERGGAALAGIAAAVQLLPSVVVAPLMSMASDRYRRDLPLRWTYTIEATALAFVGLAMLSNLPTAATIAIAALAATTVACARPAHGSLVPDLANHPDEVTAANVVTSMADAIGVLAGPAIAAAILVVGGPGHVFLLMGAGVATAAILVAGVRGGVPPPQRRVPVWTQLAAGVKAITAESGLGTLVVLGSARHVVVGAIDVIGVILAVEILGWGEAGAGALAGAAGVGALAGAIAATALVGRRLSRGLLAAIVVAGVPLVLLGWLSYAAAVLLLVAAAGLQWIDLIVRTLLQRAAPATTLARVLGAYEGLSSVSLASGSVLVSVLFLRAGPEVAFAVFGLLLPVVGLLLWAGIRQLDRAAPIRLEEAALLRMVPMFARLSPLVLETLAGDLVGRQTEEGETIIREGEIGDSLYLIESGEFIVEKSSNLLAVLGRGDVFGEIALLYDLARTATVRSSGPARIFSLDRQQFLRAMGATGEARLVARDLADERLGQQGLVERDKATLDE